MGIAVGYKVEAFQISELLEYLLFGGELVYLQTVGLQVGRNETQLTGEGSGALVDMRRNKAESIWICDEIQTITYRKRGKKIK